MNGLGSAPATRCPASNMPGHRANGSTWLAHGDLSRAGWARHSAYDFLGGTT